MWRVMWRVMWKIRNVGEVGCDFHLRHVRQDSFSFFRFLFLEPLPNALFLFVSFRLDYYPGKSAHRHKTRGTKGEHGQEQNI